MLSKQEDERERRETLENDRKVREREHQRLLRQGTTMFQHAQSHANDEAGGRFAAVNPTTVVGAQPPTYPQLPSSSPWSGSQPEPGPEPPLSVHENPALEPSTASSSFPVEDPGGAPSSASPRNVAAPPSFSTERDDDAA
jgi:hypothetical protein